MKPKTLGPIVEHAGTGLSMPEATARQIDELSKGLPKDFGYRRLAKSADTESVSGGDRTDISFITTDTVDRDGEVVLPGGIDAANYNRVVTFAHKYSELPIGTCQWIKSKSKGAYSGLIAKTFYPEKPADWGDAPWLPSAVLHLMQQTPPTCTGKSIGFIPTEIRPATAVEKAQRPDWTDAPIISKASLIEYAVAPVPCNAASEMQEVAAKAVRKAIDEGMFSPAVTDILREAYQVKDMDDQTCGMACPAGHSGDALSMDAGKVHCKTCGKDYDSSEMMKCEDGAKMLAEAAERQKKIADALAAPFYTPEQIARQAENLRQRQIEDAAAKAKQRVLDMFWLKRGTV